MNTWDATFLVFVGGLIGFLAGWLVSGFWLEPVLEELEELRRREFFRRTAEEMVDEWWQSARREKPCRRQDPDNSR